jgi:PhzF family phenazine biosynthesis protein
MKTRAFKQVDVFTSTTYYGNPLAVVLDGAGLSDDEMQRFARWTNLSETTFVLPPTQAGADYRLRIFTPGGELPFAGHPTLGTCHAWLEAGRRIGGQIPIQNGSISEAQSATTKLDSDPQFAADPQFFVQECKVGLVRIRRAGHLLAFAAPPLQRSTPDAALLARVAAALGIEPQQIRAAQLLDNGPVWLGLLLDSVDTVLGLAPDHLALKNMNQKVGVAALYPRSEAPVLIARASREARAFADHAADPAKEATPDLEVRGFAAPVGVNEDPVTGSLNASLAQWLIADDHMPARYLAAQGACLGRAGRVHIERDDAGQVWVGGQAVTCVDGEVKL